MAAATEKSAKPARKRTTPARRRTRNSPTPTQAQIAERAYFISLQPDAADELSNWVRAERELAAA